MISTYATNQLSHTWGKISLAHNLSPAKTLTIFPVRADNDYIELEVDVITQLNTGESDITQILNIGTDFEANNSFLHVFRPDTDEPSVYIKNRKKWSDSHKQEPKTQISSNTNSMEINISTRTRGSIYARIDDSNLMLCVIPHKEAEKQLQSSTVVSVLYDRINDMIIINAPKWGIITTYPLSSDICDLIINQNNLTDEILEELKTSTSEIITKRLKEFIKYHTMVIDTSWPVSNEFMKNFKDTDMTFTPYPAFNEKDIKMCQMPDN